MNAANRTLLVNCLCTLAALAVSNFLFQSLQAQPDYVAACERTYFQAAALVIVFYMNVADGMVRRPRKKEQDK